MKTENIHKSLAKQAKHIDKEYILKGKRLSQSSWEKLFKDFINIPSYDPNKPENRNMMVKQVDFFEELLSPEARKVYLTRHPNTVLEYYKNSNWLVNLFEQSPHKPFSFGFRYRISVFLQKIFKVKRKAILCQYLGKTIELSSFDNFKTYIRRMAELFNKLVELGVMERATLCPMLIMPLASFGKQKVAILLYSYSKFDKGQINRMLENDIAHDEGALPNSDWTNIESGLKVA